MKTDTRQKAFPPPPFPPPPPPPENIVRHFGDPFLRHIECDVISTTKWNVIRSLLPEKKNMPPPPRRRRRRYQLKRHVKRRARDGVDPSREEEAIHNWICFGFSKVFEELHY